MIFISTEPYLKRRDICAWISVSIYVVQTLLNGELYHFSLPYLKYNRSQSINYFTAIFYNLSPIPVLHTLHPPLWLSRPVGKKTLITNKQSIYFAIDMLLFANESLCLLKDKKKGDKGTKQIYLLSCLCTSLGWLLF